jgi:hypothetical protein
MRFGKPEDFAKGVKDKAVLYPGDRDAEAVVQWIATQNNG